MSDPKKPNASDVLAAQKRMMGLTQRPAMPPAQPPDAFKRPAAPSPDKKVK